MAMNIKNRDYDIRNYEEIGNVKVSDEVIMVIAGLAATEVEGVSSIAGNITNEIISKAGAKSLSKGLRVSFDEEKVKVDIGITIDYGYSIPVISQQVQEKIKSTIENMTGLSVISVNVRIAGVNLAKMD